MKQRSSASSLAFSSGCIHGITVEPNVSCLVFFYFPADIFVLWAAVCLCGREVSWSFCINYMILNSSGLFMWCFRCEIETMRNKDHTYILGVFYMRSSYGDKLVWHRCLYSLSTLHTRWVWIETQGLLQWNTRENPSASVYRANPYLLLKLEAEMSVRWDAEMINITAGMWRLWSISHIQYLSVAHPVMLLLIVWITGFQNTFLVILQCNRAAECRIKQCIMDSRCRITLWIF